MTISDPKKAEFCAQGSPENQRDYGNPVSEIIEQHPKDPGFFTHVAPGSQQMLGAQASAGVRDLGLDFVNSGPGTQCFQGLVQAASRPPHLSNTTISRGRCKMGFGPRDHLSPFHPLYKIKDGVGRSHSKMPEILGFWLMEDRHHPRIALWKLEIGLYHQHPPLQCPGPTVWGRWVQIYLLCPPENNFCLCRRIWK